MPVSRSEEPNARTTILYVARVPNIEEEKQPKCGDPTKGDEILGVTWIVIQNECSENNGDVPRPG